MCRGVPRDLGGSMTTAKNYRRTSQTIALALGLGANACSGSPPGENTLDAGAAMTAVAGQAATPVAGRPGTVARTGGPEPVRNDGAADPFPPTVPTTSPTFPGSGGFPNVG